MYYDYMELEKYFERNVAVLLSRSSVIASQDTDFKTNLKTVLEMREGLDDRMPYKVMAMGGKTAAQISREEMSARYLAYAEKVFGKERIQEYLKNGQRL